MKILFAIISAFIFVSCKPNNITCTVEDTLNAAIVSQFQALAACKNPAGLMADLTKLEVPLNLCPVSAMQKGIVQDACLALLPLLEAAASGNHILIDGQCDLTAGTAAQLLQKACGAIPAALKQPKVIKH